MQLGVGRDLYYPGTEPPAHPITPTVVSRHEPLVRRYAYLPPSHQHSAVEMVSVVGKPTLKIELISNGTVTVPVSDHHEIRLGTLQSIIRQSGIARSEFESQG
jgi:hypothetical protein